MMGDVYRIIVKGNHINGTGQKGSAMDTSVSLLEATLVHPFFSEHLCIYKHLCVRGSVYPPNFPL